MLRHPPSVHRNRPGPPGPILTNVRVPPPLGRASSPRPSVDSTRSGPAPARPRERRATAALGAVRGPSSTPTPSTTPLDRSVPPQLTSDAAARRAAASTSATCRAAPYPGVRVHASRLRGSNRSRCAARSPIKFCGLAPLGRPSDRPSHLLIHPIRRWRGHERRGSGALGTASRPRPSRSPRTRRW